MTDSAGANRLWDKREAAAYLRVAVSTLSHWVSDRRIPYVKLGRLVRFRKGDLDRFIARNVRARRGRPVMDESGVPGD